MGLAFKNNFKSTNLIGLLIMTGFSLVAFFRWHQTGLVFYLLLVFRDLMVAYYFIKRTGPTKNSSKLIATLAYVSASLPLCYANPREAAKELFFISDLLAIVGFLLATVATIDLGKSFGVTPAKREVVTSGVYKWIKHPMYTGYVLSEAGLVILNMNNLFLFLISLSFYIWRARTENKILHSN